MSHNDIDQRLDRYMSLRDDRDLTSTDFNSEQHILDHFDRIDAGKQSGAHRLYVCERNTVCLCKNLNECNCDADDYSEVLSVELIHASNNTMIIRMGFHHAFKTSQMKNMRFFTLNESTDEETPVMDVLKTVRKNSGKRKYVESSMVRIGDKSYDVEGNPRVYRGDCSIRVNYMYWTEHVKIH